MSNRDKGGVTQDQMRGYIVDALADIPPDILALIYRIIFYAESGLE